VQGRVGQYKKERELEKKKHADKVEREGKLIAKRRELNNSESEKWFDLPRPAKYYFDLKDAKNDIDIANIKIDELKKVIKKQTDAIQKTKLKISQTKQLEKKSHPVKKVGRPEKSPGGQEIALKFMSQWVKSLMEALDVQSCAKLEEYINGSSQRNWLRWLSSQAVPNRKNLLKLLTSEIMEGDYKGKPLHNVPTQPEYEKLLVVVGLT
jgi:hypothetical protein